MSSNDASDSLCDRNKTLKNISALYTQGDTKGAFDLLDALLGQYPDDPELRLVKAEWSVERCQQAPHVGQTAAQLRAGGQTSLRERRLIHAAVAWAEGACTAARQALAGGRPDLALREFRTACELAPWDASLFFSRAVLLNEYAATHDIRGDLSSPTLPGLPGSNRSRSQDGPPLSDQLHRDIETALMEARALAEAGEPLWLEATQLLAEWMGRRQQWDVARSLLEEAAQSGADVAHQRTALEERMTEKSVGDVVDRVRQLMRRGNLGMAGDLLAGAIQAAPQDERIWLALADWFMLRKHHQSAESIYQWVRARDGSVSPSANGANQALLGAVAERINAVNMECRRCRRALGAEVRTCPACGHPVGEVELPGDTLAQGALAPQESASIGLIEIYVEQNRLVEALHLVQELIGRLDRQHPSLQGLGELMESLEPRAVRNSYETALDEAIDLIECKQGEQALAALAGLAAHRAADDRLAAWQAIAACFVGSGLCPDHLPMIRRASRAPTAVWIRIPLSLRHRLVRLVLTAGWLEEARDLLAVAYTDAQRNTKKVRGLDEWGQRELRERCDLALRTARSALEGGSIQEALSLVDSVLALQPQSSTALLVRGEAYLACEAPYAAATDFRSVLAAEPDEAVRIAASCGIARTYELLRDLPGALRALDGLPADHPEVFGLRAHLERRRQGQPAVRVQPVDYSIHPDTLRRVEEETMNYVAIFGIALRAAARWREEDRLAIPRRDILHMGHEFIAALGGLAGAPGNPAFELRLIAEPDADLPSRGTLSLAILGRVMHPVPEGAEHLALELWDKVRAHLPLADQFLYQYEPVYDEDELETLIEPFEIRDAAEIVRRTATADRSYAVQIFSSSMGTLENVAWTLLRQYTRSLVSVHLQPTYIQANEIAAFKENLDRLRRLRIPKHEDEDGADSSAEEEERTVILPDGARGTLVEQVAYLANALEKQAFLMSITVASEEPHAELLSHAVAAELFGPGGRYEVVHATDDVSLDTARSNIAGAELERWAPATTPRRLARLRYLVSELEAGWTFRLPMPGVEGIPGVPQIGVKAAPPTRLPAEGIAIGETAATIAGVPADIRFLQSDRRRHMYVLGKTGVGKSTLLETMALQDICEGRGVMFLDAHGDSIEAILSRIPAERADDIIVFDPADSERPIGVNILQNEDDHQKHRIASEFVEMLIKMYDPNHIGIAGPIWQHTGRMGLLTAMMALPDATLVDVVRILTDEDYGRRLGKRVDDPLVRIYWEEEVPRTSAQRKGEMLTYIVSKFNRFTGDLRLRNIVGQAQSALNFRRILDERKILLVSLSKGKIGPESAEFLGFIVLQSLLIAALSRADRAYEEREDYCLYVDEFQTFATQSFAALLSEGRKYGICLVMANQYLAQLTPSLREAVFGNVGTVAAFQVDATDGHTIAPQFYPVFGPDDLINLPRYTAAVRLMVDGQATRPFAMRTRLAPHLPDGDAARRIREMSRLRYGRNVAEVNREIGARFKL